MYVPYSTPKSTLTEDCISVQPRMACRSKQNAWHVCAWSQKLKQVIYKTACLVASWSWHKNLNQYWHEKQDADADLDPRLSTVLMPFYKWFTMYACLQNNTRKRLAYKHCTYCQIPYSSTVLFIHVCKHLLNKISFKPK